MAQEMERQLRAVRGVRKRCDRRRALVLLSYIFFFLSFRYAQDFWLFALRRTRRPACFLHFRVADRGRSLQGLAISIGSRSTREKCAFEKTLLFNFVKNIDVFDEMRK